MDINKTCYLFFDYDGTVYHDRIIPDEIKESLEKIQQKGHRIYLNTGRSFGNLRKNERYTEIQWDGIICGGADIMIDGEHIVRTGMDTQLESIPWMKYSMDHRYIFAYGGQEAFKRYMFNEAEAPLTEEEKEAYLTEFLTFSKNNPATKLTILSSADAIDYSDIPSTPNVDLVPINDKTVELYQKGKQKGYAIRTFCEYFGVEIGQCACFGDSMNDGDMFDACENAIAMQNSPDELITRASYHATGEGYGVVEGLEHLFGKL